MEPRSVLVVDDDLPMRQLLASLFRDEGYRVEVEHSAMAALAHAALTEFDAVLSDVNMPGASGLELVRELKRVRPGTRVILMSGRATRDGAEAARRAGAFDYLEKPFELERVHCAVGRAIEDRGRD